MMRSPTRTMTASTTSAADSDAAARVMQKARCVFFIDVCSDVLGDNKLRRGLFVFDRGKGARVAVGEAAWEDGDIHVLAARGDELSHFLPDSVLPEAISDDGRGGLETDRPRLAPFVHLENMEAVVRPDHTTDRSRLQSKNLVLEHLRQIATSDEADVTAPL